MFWLFYNLHGCALRHSWVPFPRTLSKISGFLWHSSKWACWFSCFLQYTSGLEVLDAASTPTLTMCHYDAPTVPFLEPLSKVVATFSVYSHRKICNPSSALSWTRGPLLHFLARSLTSFLSTLTFCVVIISLTHMLPASLIALTLYMCTSIYINFLSVYSIEQ